MSEVVKGNRVVCCGDIMVEIVSHRLVDSDLHCTLVVEDMPRNVGGAVLNMAWYLSQLDCAHRVISHYGEDTKKHISDFFSRISSDHEGVVLRQRLTDRLILAPQTKMPAVYLKGEIDESSLQREFVKVASAHMLIFNGSRHPTFGRLISDHISTAPDTFYIFSPSYALYDFDKESIFTHIAKSNLFVVNEDEAKYLMALFSSSIDDIAGLSRGGGIVTRGFRGADLYRKGRGPVHFPSRSHSTEDVIGAGEAFLSGFVCSVLKGSGQEQAGDFGALVAAQIVRSGTIRTQLDLGELSISS